MIMIILILIPSKARGYYDDDIDFQQGRKMMVMIYLTRSKNDYIDVPMCTSIGLSSGSPMHGNYIYPTRPEDDYDDDGYDDDNNYDDGYNDNGYDSDRYDDDIMILIMLTGLSLDMNYDTWIDYGIVTFVVFILACAFPITSLSLYLSFYLWGGGGLQRYR